jgi:hypothetical protein
MNPNVISDIKTRSLESLNRLVRREYFRLTKNSLNYDLNKQENLVHLNYDGLIPSKLIKKIMK